MSAFAVQDTHVSAALRAIPCRKKIYWQEPIRDLGQLSDNRIPTSPAILRHDRLTREYNRVTPEDSLFSYMARESDSGAAPEIHANIGAWTLQDIKRQGEALPRATSDGKPYYLAFLMRALSGFYRSALAAEDVELQIRESAKAAAANGQIGKFSIFDARNRKEWLREDFETVYKIHAEGIPIALEGVISISDERDLTPEEFADRVRDILELDKEAREKFNIKESVMISFALKNTDGRMRGVGSFADGNVGEYCAVLLKELDGNLTENGTGPKQARYHTHDIGYADESVEAFADAYLNASTQNGLSICVDVLSGTTDSGDHRPFPCARPLTVDFADPRILAHNLRNNRGWDVAPFSRAQNSILDDKAKLLQKITAPFRQSVYKPSAEAATRFHCAPAALQSGIRFGALAHFNELSLRLNQVQPDGYGSLEAARERLYDAVMCSWGLYNAACKRLLGNMPSITPVANLQNIAAGSILGANLEGVWTLFVDGKHPLSIPDADYDALALRHFAAIQHPQTADYVTRADAGICLEPNLFRHLCEVRSRPVLTLEQDKSFFADQSLQNYDEMRRQLLEAITDKDEAVKILTDHAVPAETAGAFVEKYIGYDTSDPRKMARSVLPMARNIVDELIEGKQSMNAALSAVAQQFQSQPVEALKAALIDVLEGTEFVRVDDPRGELLSAAPNLGPSSEERIKRLLTQIAVKPINLSSKQSYGLDSSEGEQQLEGVFRENKVSSFASLFIKNPEAAVRAGKLYIENPGRYDCGIGEFLFFPPPLPYEQLGIAEQVNQLKADYARSILGVCMSLGQRCGLNPVRAPSPF